MFGRKRGQPRRLAAFLEYVDVCRPLIERVDVTKRYKRQRGGLWRWGNRIAAIGRRRRPLE